MVFYAAGVHLASGALPLAETVEIAHAHGVPVVVDAAAQLPPTENLWRFTREFGADLAVFSGGKDFHGPQASGLLVGTEAMIAAIAVNGSPHQRLARPMKVGKEEMIGLLAAVERYVDEDWQDRARRYEETVERWIEYFRGLPGVSASRVFPNEAGQPTPRCRVTFAAETGLSGAEVARLLWEGDPRIAVAVDGPDAISMTPELLEEGDESILLDRIVALTPGAGGRVGVLTSDLADAARRALLVRVVATEDEAGVLTAESEGVLRDDVDRGGPRAAVDDVEPDRLVRRLVVERRRDRLVGDGAHRRDRLQRA